MVPRLRSQHLAKCYPFVDEVNNSSRKKLSELLDNDQVLVQDNNTRKKLKCRVIVETGRRRRYMTIPSGRVFGRNRWFLRIDGLPQSSEVVNLLPSDGTRTTPRKLGRQRQGDL